jgi:hypothetical protein
MVAISQTKTVQKWQVLEKLTAKKQDTNNPIQDNKPWQKAMATCCN